MTNYAIIVGVTGMSELRPDKLSLTNLESSPKVDPSLSAPIKTSSSSQTLALKS